MVSSRGKKEKKKKDFLESEILINAGLASFVGVCVESRGRGENLGFDSAPTRVSRVYIEIGEQHDQLIRTLSAYSISSLYMGNRTRTTRDSCIVGNHTIYSRLVSSVHQHSRLDTFT